MATKIWVVVWVSTGRGLHGSIWWQMQRRLDIYTYASADRQGGTWGSKNQVGKSSYNHYRRYTIPIRSMSNIPYMDPIGCGWWRFQIFYIFTPFQWGDELIFFNWLLKPPANFDCLVMISHHRQSCLKKPNVRLEYQGSMWCAS